MFEFWFLGKFDTAAIKTDESKSPIEIGSGSQTELGRGREREGENSFQQTKENYVKFVAVVGCKVVKRQQTKQSLKIFSSVVWGERAQVISLRKYPVIEKKREQGLTIAKRSSCRDDESKHT